MMFTQLLGTAVSFDSGFRPALLERPACPSLALSLPSWPAEPGPRPST